MRILITGTSKGIGLELCQLFLNNGNDVIGLSRTESAIRHNKYKHYCLNVSSEQNVRKIFKENINIDLVINNAAVAEKNHLLLSSHKSIEEMFATNLIAPILIAKEYSKACICNKTGGEILNFSSIATDLLIPGEIIYTVTKKALEEFTKQSSLELSHFDISISAIKLGLFRIGMGKNISNQESENILFKSNQKKASSTLELFSTINHILSLPKNQKNGKTFNMDQVY